MSHAACKMTQFDFITAFSAILGLILVKIKVRTSLAYRGVFSQITKLLLGSAVWIYMFTTAKAGVNATTK